MNMSANSKEIVFINPYDTRGGASMGTFRLFSYFRDYVSSDVRLLVIVKRSLKSSGVFGLSWFFRFLFYIQAAFNKLICSLFSSSRLPVAFTLLVPLSLPALALLYKSRRASKLYLHSMGGGFACPVSFSLLLRKASVVKTADDWYLTGGCHYSLDCDQWKDGCKSCPFMNPIGKLIIRLNWLCKQKILSNSLNFVFVSPSNWLSMKYKLAYPGRCSVIYNSASDVSENINDDFTCPVLIPFPSVHYKTLGSAASSSLLTLGLPVTYLRDKRKGFYDALPLILDVLQNYPVRFVLCGGDASNYFDIISSKLQNLHPSAKIESLGPLDASEMPVFYTNLDLVLHFAQYDNSPNVVTESLCSGIPVIVLNNAGSPEHVISSSAGFVINDLSDFIDIVDSLCRGCVDIDDLKLRASSYSQKVLSAKSMADEYSKLFSNSPGAIVL